MTYVTFCKILRDAGYDPETVKRSELCGHVASNYVDQGVDLTDERVRAIRQNFALCLVILAAGYDVP